MAIPWSLPENVIREQSLEVRNYYINGWERAIWDEEQFIQKPWGGNMLGFFKKQKALVNGAVWVRRSTEDERTETPQQN